MGVLPDLITEEEKLEMNALLIENLTEGVIVTNSAQKIIQANRAFLRLTGYSEAEIMGKSPKILRSGKHKAKFYKEMWRSIHQTGRWEGEIWNRKKNGEIFLQEMTINKVKIAGKEKIYYVGLYRDITVRKKMELELQRREKLYSSILSTISEGLIVINEAGDVILTNNRAAELLGIPYDELLGNNLYAASFDVVRGDGTPSTMKCTGLLTLESGNPSDNDVGGIKHHSNQQMTWVSCNSQPLYIDEEKILSGAVITMTDITSLKQNEVRLKDSNTLMSNLIENLQSGVILVDADQRIKFINTDFCRFLDLDYEPEWYIGKDVTKTVLNELHAKQSEFIAAIRSFTARAPGQDEEVHLKNGKVFTLTFVPICINQHRQLFFWKITDVTLQKRIESTIIAAKENAEQANRSKSKFLSMMSHELRTPLNGILGFAQLLECDPEVPLTVKQRESVAEILGAGRHLLNLIDEILDLAKIETQTLRLSTRWVNIQAIIQECMQIVKTMAAKRNIKLVDLTRVSENIWIHADPTRLNQILQNLLTNAIKYNHDGGEIVISAQKRTHDIKIEVEDTGIGIPKEEIDHIFEPFYRLDSAKASTEGSGIGLALVQQLIQLMGGKYGVDSEEGKGSCFWVCLPLVVPPDRNEEAFHAKD